MTNLLEETLEAVSASEHTPDQIVHEEAEDAVKAREAAGKSVDPGADIDRES